MEKQSGPAAALGKGAAAEKPGLKDTRPVLKPGLEQEACVTVGASLFQDCQHKDCEKKPQTAVHEVDGSTVKVHASCSGCGKACAVDYRRPKSGE